MIIFTQESHYSQVFEFLVPSTVTWKKRNAVFHTNLVTTVLNILFQGVCIPQRISKKRDGCFQLYFISSNVVQVRKEQDKYIGKHVALSNMGNMKDNSLWTHRDSLCDLIRHSLTDLAPSPSISIHINTFAGSCAQAPKKDKDDFSVFWLAVNDPPDLCWDKVASSFFDCKYNLQFIGKCVIICITRNIFTMKSFYCFICDITSQACISASSFLTWPRTEKDSFCHYRCQLSSLFPIHAYITPD